MSAEHKKIVTECEIQKDVSGEPVFIVSKEVIDRDGDIVKVAGMDLKNFKKNPVMLWSHNKNEPAIGTWTSIKKTKDSDGVPVITMKPKFSTSDNHKLARVVSDLVDEGIIKSASVSFKPDWDTVEIITGKNKKEHRVITKSDLYEVSIVNIGANQAAMAKAYDEGIISKADMNILDGVEDTTDSIEDLQKQLNEKEIKIVELNLLIKEQTMQEELEEDIYTEIFNSFEATSDANVSADGDHIESDNILDDIYDLL